MQDYEKLGAFYLGKSYDVDAGKQNDDLILYDSKDLTTHAVIIGMTGSGKTGLGIGILEEAAIDKVPIIAVDPKGDLGNILLTFPQLQPSDFQPWVNAQEAANNGKTVEAYAQDQAQLWRKGLENWGQSGERIQRLRDSVDLAMYTPGSSAGIPISVLRSFVAPPAVVRDDRDLYRERIQATATSILALLDVEADPITSREHILISTLLQHSWDQGQDLDIAGLITAIQQPPVQRVGVMDLDSFFPPKDRFALAMRLNNLLAAPGFDVWMEGDALDAQRLLYTESGQPRVAVISIAHLSDAERMFFVTMLLNEVLSWMRRQPGTSSLRAILYIDEIFGYMPPTANPASKTLLLTLLKQARAYGLGLVLATQNPVDLDYKGLSNTGTWFIGRLQTERDKARVMEGLEGAATESGFDRQHTEQILAGLGKRRFLLHNVHENSPVVFATRWVMSYLAGPMTREQIKRLSAGQAAAAASKTPAPVQPPAPRAVETKAEQSAPPMLPPDVRQYYLPTARAAANAELVYHPFLLGAADVGYNSARYDVNLDRSLMVMTEITDGPAPVDWDDGDVLELAIDDLRDSGSDEASFSELDPAANNVKNYAKWEKLFKRWIRVSQPVTLLCSKRFKLIADVAESEGEFRSRLQIVAHEQRDIKIGKLRKSYGKKITTLENRLLRAEQRIETEQSQSRQKKMDTAVAFGTAVLGAFLGRKRVTSTSASRMGTAVRSAGRMRKEKADVARAAEIAESVRAEIAAVSTAFEEEVEALEVDYDAQTDELTEVTIKPKSADIHIHLVGIGWAPYQRGADGQLDSAWN
ncbi:MAG: DUF87 domain-containing protein [Gammaproteobacteria bacterium]|nr:DUF87 domain-containing protein [Gammaproteobacteria bacterium]